MGLAFVTFGRHYVDLSIPGIMALSGAVAITALEYGFAASLVAGMAAGVLIGLINGLVDLAFGEKNHAANVFLQWFVTEQVEEEASVLEIAEQLKLAGDQGCMLFMLDRELGRRTQPPAPAA